MLRRDFLINCALATGLLPQLGKLLAAPPAKAAAKLHAPLIFGSAQAAARAIRRKKISSFELTRLIFDQIDRHNPRLNAFAYLMRESALKESHRADERLARREALGPLHGVPVHVKESFGVAGQPCTWGLAEHKNAKAAANAHAVNAFLSTGAILLGGTNVAEALADWQSFNPVYGTTNNPWDARRTPGGSSGGSAAALAAGMGFLSVGSDLAGSIRIPAHFCGIYGHKPTVGLVSGMGQAPGGAQGNPGAAQQLEVSGPMARTAGDLRAALQLLGGARGDEALAWRWKLPAPRRRTLKDFRAGYIIEDPGNPLSDASKKVLERYIEGLSKRGVRLKKGWPEGFSQKKLLDNYVFLLEAGMFSSKPPDELQAIQEQSAGKKETELHPGLSSYGRWALQDSLRLEFRAQWQAYFREFDVFLCPVTLTEAFPHDHRKFEDRTLDLPGAKHSHLALWNWISAATLTGCPATTAPAGLTDEGLPVGIQVVGPLWEDDTPITFCEMSARELGGFTPPLQAVAFDLQHGIQSFPRNAQAAPELGVSSIGRNCLTTGS